jgi:hypothetical protein
VLLPSLVALACSRPTGATAPVSDASAAGEVSVHVPAALTVARGIDTLSVAIDPASLGSMQVGTHAGTTLGVEANVSVFAQGRPEPILEHRCAATGADFAVCASAWSTRRDGVPLPGTTYAVEMRLVLFETNAPLGDEWDPHAGSFTPLWTRTLRQAEE